MNCSFSYQEKGHTLCDITEEDCPLQFGETCHKTKDEVEPDPDEGVYSFEG